MSFGNTVIAVLVRNTRLALFALSLVISIVAPTIASERRVALVIGNGAYRHAPTLTNPVNDARAVAEALGKAGFEVNVGFDLDISRMQSAVARFEQQIGDAQVALVYYAGHGIAVDGVNYLIPVDAELEGRYALQRETISADVLLGQVMEREGRVSIMILDSCRNNPFTRSFAGRIRGAAVGTGLAQVQAVDGSYVAFATAPGALAQDGEGQNSPFTAALIKQMTVPGLEIESMMKIVRREVRDQTNQSQVPWASSGLLGDFYFMPSLVPKNLPLAAATTVPSPPRNEGEVLAIKPPPVTATSAEERAWLDIVATNNPKLIEWFIRTYPTSPRTDDARHRLSAAYIEFRNHLNEA